MAVLAALFALGLSLNGTTWGQVEAWHPDQMAFRELFAIDGQPGNPGWFYRPPFFSYLIHGLVVWPLEGLGPVLGLDAAGIHRVQLIGARAVAALLLAGLVLVAYQICVRSFDRNSARAVALIAASSAGLVMHSAFLTVDLPLAFLMLWSLERSLAVAAGAGPRAGIAAGLLAGLAAATKYNGALALAPLAMAHLLAAGRSARPSGWTMVASTGLSVSAAVLAFLAANPYAVLDWRRFVAHLDFNLWVVPRYDGIEPGPLGVWPYLAAHPELLGWPVALLSGVALVNAVWALVRRRAGAPAGRLTMVVLALVIPYAALAIASPRVEPRFVLPVLPALLLLLPFLWCGWPRRRIALLLAPVLLYNLACAVQIGPRLLADPRMAAIDWMALHVRPGDRVLSTFHAPTWARLTQVPVRDLRLPVVSGLRRLLGPMAAREPGRTAQLRAYTPSDATAAFQLPAIARSRARWIVLVSSYYERFLTPPLGTLYPEMSRALRSLIDDPPGFRLAFDARAGDSPPWVYPARIPILPRRVVILERIATVRDGPARSATGRFPSRHRATPPAKPAPRG